MCRFALQLVARQSVGLCGLYKKDTTIDFER